MFTDNDELSGMIASMMDMQALIILSYIDGIYNGSPSTPGTQVIREVEQGLSLIHISFLPDIFWLYFPVYKKSGMLISHHFHKMSLKRNKAVVHSSSRR